MIDIFLLLISIALFYLGYRNGIIFIFLRFIISITLIFLTFIFFPIILLLLSSLAIVNDGIKLHNYEVNPFILIILFLLVFLIFKTIMKRFSQLFKGHKIKKIPVIGFLNKIFGVIFIICAEFILVSMYLAILVVYNPSHLNYLINSSFILGFIYNNLIFLTNIFVDYIRVFTEYF